MPFRFTLRGPLRLREMQERVALRALQSIAAQAARVRADIASADASLEAARREVWSAAAAGLPAAQLHFHAVQEAALRERRRLLFDRLQELESARQKQQARYRLVRQQREVLSSLRERQLAVYDLEQSRRAQREIDELFLLRRCVRKE
jgi:flagellar export protein FliJ